MPRTSTRCSSCQRRQFLLRGDVHDIVGPLVAMEMKELLPSRA